MFSAINAKLKGWRTVILNALIGVPSALLLLGSQFQDSGVDFTPLLKRYLSADDILLLMTLVSALGIVLRFVTSTPVGKRT